MKDLLKKINIELDDVKNPEIIDIVYNKKTREVKIYIQGEGLVSSAFFSEVEDKLTKYLVTPEFQNFSLKIIYKTKEQKYDSMLVINYYHKILQNNSFLYDILNGIEIEVTPENNTIVFDLSFERQQKQIQEILSILNVEFNRYGFNSFNYEYHLKNITKKKEELEQKVQDYEDMQKEIVANTDKKKSHLLFGKNDLKNMETFSIKKVLNPDHPVRLNKIEGIIFDLELRDLKNSALLTLMISDNSGTIIAKKFTGFGGKSPKKEDFSKLHEGMYIELSGNKTFDKYLNDDVFEIQSLSILNNEELITTRIDEAKEKRVELHLHSKMSKNNGVSSLEDYAKIAKKFGHAGFGLTDHNVVQGFVDAEKVSQKYNLKITYGLEASVVEKPQVVRNADNQDIQSSTYTVFDLETTGLSANFNKLIEIGAVKIKDGQILDRFQCFIKIEEKLSEFTTSLTGITNEDINGGIELFKALKLFKEFYANTILVAHNATFDYQFLDKNEREILKQKIEEPTLDTLELSRILNPENTYHSLKILSKKYGVELDNSAHHRADYDSEKLAELFILMLNQIKNDDQFKTFKVLSDLDKTEINKTRGFHELIYVKNQKGLKEIYKLVSDAHTKDFLMEPRIRTKEIEQCKNLIRVGSGCIKSRLIDYYLNKPFDELKELIQSYDYIELHPKDQYSELIKNGTFKSMEQIISMHKDLIKIAKEAKTKVIISGNVHFTNPELYKIKEILRGKDYKPDKVRKNKETKEEELIDKIRFKKLVQEKGTKDKNQYFHTTEEMIEEFEYLNDKEKEEFIIANPTNLLTEVEELKIVPDDLYTPDINGVDQKLKEEVYKNAHEIYGEVLDDLIAKRIEKEVNSITKYGFSVIYYISSKLVKYSLNNGYLVGSRGSVGSSIVATLMDITEINPLPPHYICKKCKKSEFFLNGEYASGYDLPDKNCPNCNILYQKNGQDIPFETFLGFEGDKVPDIDLNFSGDFQAKAHDYVRSKNKLNDPELFDDSHAFRAGTIGTIATKTAYAYTKNYFDLIDTTARRSDVLYYAKYCEGIKRTTGQHPGGIIVVPNHLDIYQFTAIQYPADDINQSWQTTHFDFHSIHDNLLKLDILGHDDPTMLKKLFDLTNIDPKNVDVSDQKIMELFTSTNSIGIQNNEYLELGTLGIPEFGTDFVISMLKDTKPATFSELVQISGLSHGTDVWLGNAKELIDNKVCTIKNVIGCRDDIMVFLMYQGIDAANAFSIMENVRKGRGLTQNEEELLKSKQIPDWYIKSCKKIKYMFPKAHAAAYVLMALRIAYYKVYYPLAYYCAYFSSRVDEFDPIAMLKGEKYLIQRIEMVDEIDDDISTLKKKNLINSLKMSLEMVLRGFEFLRFDLNKSEAKEFVIDDEQKGLILPFSIIEGLGEKEALSIIEERQKKKFSTKQDLKKRTRLKKKSLEQLEYFNVLNDLEESNQISLF